MRQITKSSSALFSTELLALYAMSFLIGTSLGFFNPLISTFMEQQQIDSISIGANSTLYFLAIALATPLVEKKLRQIPFYRILMFGLLLTGISTSLFPWTTMLPLWFILRIVMGIGVCCLLVGSQTALNNFSHENNRASINGLYFLALGIGFGLGPAIAPRIYATSPQLAFCFGGLILLGAVVFVRYSFPRDFIVSVPSRALFLTTLKKSKISISGGFLYGFVEATLISLYPLFLLRQNYSLAQVGYSFSIFVLGSILFTLPVTYLADRFGKTKILFISLWIGLLATLGLILFEQYQLTLLFSFWIGAGVGPIYPLCLSLIGEQLPKQELPSGTALFMTIYSFGCALGPILSSIAIATLGSRHTFSLCILLYTIVLWRIAIETRR